MATDETADNDGVEDYAQQLPVERSWRRVH